MRLVGDVGMLVHHLDMVMLMHVPSAHRRSVSVVVVAIVVAVAMSVRLRQVAVLVQVR